MKKFNKGDKVYVLEFDDKTCTYILREAEFIAYLSTCHYRSKSFSITIGQFTLELSIIPNDKYCSVNINGNISTFWSFDIFNTINSAKKHVKKKLKDPAYKYHKYSLEEHFNNGKVYFS